QSVHSGASTGHNPRSSPCPLQPGENPSNPPFASWAASSSHRMLATPLEFDRPLYKDRCGWAGPHGPGPQPHPPFPLAPGLCGGYTDKGGGCLEPAGGGCSPSRPQRDVPPPAQLSDVVSGPARNDRS